MTPTLPLNSEMLSQVATDNPHIKLALAMISFLIYKPRWYVHVDGQVGIVIFSFIMVTAYDTITVLYFHQL